MAKHDIARFRGWLGTQQHRGDVVGRFARYWLGCLCTDCLELRTLSGLNYHLRHVHGAPDEVLTDRDHAWRLYPRLGVLRRQQKGGRS